MAVRYIVVPHKIPSKPDEPLAYYPRLKSSGEVSLREMAKDIASGSTVSTADTVAVIEGLLQNIPRYLAEGKIVRLGELGSFHLSIEAEGSPDPGSVNRHKIKRNKLNFRAGRLMKQMLENIAYVKD